MFYKSICCGWLCAGNASHNKWQKIWCPENTWRTQTGFQWSMHGQVEKEGGAGLWLSDFVDISVMLKFVAFLILAYILSLNVSRGMIFMYHVPWCVFFQYLAQRKKQETEEKRLKQKKAREEFLVMLEVCPSCLLLLLMLFFLVVTEETEKQDFKNQTSWGKETVISADEYDARCYRMCWVM